MLEKVARSGQHRDMKNQISFRIVVAAAALALLAGCAMFQESGQSALVGTWTNSLGTVWAIRADGTFDVDLANYLCTPLGKKIRSRSMSAPRLEKKSRNSGVR